MEIKFEVVLYGKPLKVNSLKEAEEKIKRIDQSDFHCSYIVRKEYDKNGKLINEVMVG